MRRRYIAPFRMLYGGGPLPTWGIGQVPPSPVNSKSNHLLPASDETHTRRRERILRLDPDAAGDAGRWPPLRFTQIRLGSTEKKQTRREMRAPAQAGASTLRALEATAAPDFAEVAEVPMPSPDEAAAHLSNSPPSPGSWNNRSYNNQA
ncbi:uncharacterized protein LOC124677432 [Lolium rigidum]|uniref:uncharacterized protein LOC124677432 n=1 Tax=Lolium rigidum TaxID=89674 RepID=UPI001F5D8B3C|nr:uncharacterized protein LOC124677432 [Lolium rigidum]